MSADNWAVCPKCFLERKKFLDEMETKHNASYGKISAEEFLKNQNKLTEEEETPMAATLREDYEIGINNDGVSAFFVSYSAECYVCKFDFSFEHDVELEMPT